MRAADAIEKITQVRPELLRPHVDTLLAIAASAEDKEVRWHVAQLLGRVTLKTNQRDEAVKVLLAYLSDKRGTIGHFEGGLIVLPPRLSIFLRAASISSTCM